MYVGDIPVLLGTFLLAVGTSAQSADDEYVSNMNCIATSANQDLCDEFLDCNKYLAQSVSYVDEYCKQTLSLNGPESCTKDEELFRNEDTRNKLHNCITNLTTELTDEEEEEMKIYAECVAVVGDKCQRGAY